MPESRRTRKTRPAARQRGDDRKKSVAISPVGALDRLVIRRSPPLLHAIAFLDGGLTDINAEWRRGLERVARTRSEWQTLAEMNPGKVLLDFRRTRFAGFRSTLIRQGEILAVREIPLESAITASGDFLKLCLEYLPRRTAGDRSMALSLIRFTSVGQLLLISGYTAQRTHLLQKLEQDLAAAREQLQSLSRIITDVYDQERRSISRDLHDEVGHDLVVVKLYLEVISRDLADGRAAKLPRKLDEVTALVRQAIERVRQLSFDLGPAISNELGFAAALKLYVRQFAKRTGIRVALRTSGFPSPPLPSTHEMTLYRVLQGALSNVGQHSNADRVKISLSRRRDSISMSIEDNGVGFDLKRVLGPDRAYGVLTMRERIELLGGSFRIQSTRARRGHAEHGTRIEVTVPVFANPGQ